MRRHASSWSCGTTPAKRGGLGRGADDGAARADDDPPLERVDEAAQRRRDGRRRAVGGVGVGEVLGRERREGTAHKLVVAAAA